MVWYEYDSVTLVMNIIFFSGENLEYARLLASLDNQYGTCKEQKQLSDLVKGEHSMDGKNIEQTYMLLTRNGTEWRWLKGYNCHGY